MSLDKMECKHNFRLYFVKTYNFLFFKDKKEYENYWVCKKCGLIQREILTQRKWWQLF